MLEYKKENENWNAFLFIAFWLAVLVECVGLFIKNYYVYGFSRVLLTPILLLRVFWSPSAHRISIYVYLFLLTSFLADCLSIFGNEKIAYIGLSLFTVSYLSVGCYFLQLKDNHNNSHIIFTVTLLLNAINSTLWLYVPELHTEVFYSQVALHILVLLFMVYALLASHKRIATKTYYLFFLATLVIVLSNSIYAIDSHLLNWRFPIVESLVGLGNGFYLFMITRGALRNIKVG